ncbi:MAG TPA: hypothetical protein VNN09_15435, partial [Candidatus Competibacteraceae bacterium]|nr:hypothetical protein [Candidatus Competibacteraceae bacterium]
DHQAIARWRLKQALGRTWRRRPDLLARLALDGERRRLLAEYIRELDAAEQAQLTGDSAPRGSAGPESGE